MGEATYKVVPGHKSALLRGAVRRLGFEVGHSAGILQSDVTFSAVLGTPTSAAGSSSIAVQEAAMYRRSLLTVLMTLSLAGCYGGYYESDTYTQPVYSSGYSSGYVYDNYRPYGPTAYGSAVYYSSPRYYSGPRYYNPPRYYAPPPRYYGPGYGGGRPGYGGGGWHGGGGGGGYHGGGSGYRPPPQGPRPGGGNGPGPGSGWHGNPGGGGPGPGRPSGGGRNFREDGNFGRGGHGGPGGGNR